MNVEMEIPKYSIENGFQYKWEPGFEITIKQEDNTLFLSANKAGLVSLANHLLNLAQEEVPIGYHVHFDTFNSLEDGSLELIVQKY